VALGTLTPAHIKAREESKRLAIKIDNPSLKQRFGGPGAAVPTRIRALERAQKIGDQD